MSTEALVRRTLELCRIPSVTGDEAACADFVEASLRDTGMAAQRIGHSVVARTPSRPGRPLVLLVGHTDTVPPKRTDGPVRVEGERLYGLGASDMKGGLAVMLELASKVGRGTDLRFDLGLVFYDKEEGPWSESGLGPVLEQVGWLRRAALAFCMEPTDNVIQVGCMGTLHARVRFNGRAAHSARPWQGENAIHKAGMLLVRLAAREPVDVMCSGHLFREVLSATLATGGATRNVVPDRMDLNLNYRFAPGKSLAEAQADVRAFAHDASEIEFVECAPSGRVVLDNPHLARFLAETGAAVAAKQAWTDVARLSEAGIDAVNYGPGLTAQAHQANEYIDVPLLGESYTHLARFLGLP